MTTQRCRPISVTYSAQFYSATVEENAKFLRMSPLEFVCLPDPVFLATIRAHPLECLALIDQGDEEVRSVENLRVPADVFGEAYASLLGFDVSEWLDCDEKDRGIFLDAEPQVTRIEIGRLDPDQLVEYITLLAMGVRFRDALAQASQKNAA